MPQCKSLVHRLPVSTQSEDDRQTAIHKTEVDVFSRYIPPPRFKAAIGMCARYFNSMRVPDVRDFHQEKKAM